MNDRQAELLRASPFDNLEDVRGFIEWFREPGQIVSFWDQHKYVLALEILVAMSKGVNKPAELMDCSYCGKQVTQRDMLECPKCGRPGCCDENGGCMPGGRNCICPQCECGDEDS